MNQLVVLMIAAFVQCQISLALAKARRHIDSTCKADQFYDPVIGSCIDCSAICLFESDTLYMAYCKTNCPDYFRKMMSAKQFGNTAFVNNLVKTTVNQAAFQPNPTGNGNNIPANLEPRPLIVSPEYFVSKNPLNEQPTDQKPETNDKERYINAAIYISVAFVFIIVLILVIAAVVCCIAVMKQTRAKTLGANRRNRIYQPQPGPIYYLTPPRYNKLHAQGVRKKPLIPDIPEVIP